MRPIPRTHVVVNHCPTFSFTFALKTDCKLINIPANIAKLNQSKSSSPFHCSYILSLATSFILEKSLMTITPLLFSINLSL